MAKAKIALVVDVKNWAFDNIAKQIKTNLGGYFEIEIVYSLDDFPTFVALYSYLFGGSFALVHFFWRPQLKNFFSYNFLKQLPVGFDKFFTQFSQTVVTVSVYDHLFLSPKEIKSYMPLLTGVVDGYTVSSQRLFEIYQKLDDNKGPTMIIQDGVDLSLFGRKKHNRVMTNNTSNLVVGWAGNSKWGKVGKDSKGLHSIIKPALHSLKKNGVEVRAYFADRHVKFIPLDQMCGYYNELDVYVCASDIEGTPNPVLEAMACGIPVVSTDVGIVPEVFGQQQKKFIFNRNKSDLEKKLVQLSVSVKLRRQLAQENLERITLFTRQKESEKWHVFFDQLLQKQARMKVEDHLLKMASLSSCLLDHHLSSSTRFWEIKLKNKYRFFAGINWV